MIIFFLFIGFVFFIIFAACAIYEKYHDFKVKKALRVYREYPIGLKLFIFHDKLFKYEDAHSMNINVYQMITNTKNDAEEDAIRHFTNEQCSAIYHLPKELLKQWEDDYLYVNYISENYNLGLFKYYIDNKLWKDKCPNAITQLTVNYFDKDTLHKVSLVPEKEYKRLQIIEENKYEINNRKSDYNLIMDYLKNNRIMFLYHFTDRKNIPSIVKNGGLYSWVSCIQRGIVIENPGGDNLSRRLDMRNGVADYVHLSFSPNHPMSDKKEYEGAHNVILKIHPVVTLFKETLFSTENATSNTTRIGGDASTIKLIDYKVTQDLYNKYSLFYKMKPRYREQYRMNQAEVLVKCFIPIKYILNLSETGEILF